MLCPRLNLDKIFKENFSIILPKNIFTSKTFIKLSTQVNHSNIQPNYIRVKSKYDHNRAKASQDNQLKKKKKKSIREVLCFLLKEYQSKFTITKT